MHRPGLGEIEIGSEVRNTGAVVKELFDLISVLEISEPIVLVGHSYGGLCVQHFAKSYPKMVAGMVLVDSSSVDLHELDELNLPIIDETDSDEVWLENCKSYSSMKQEQLRILLNPTLSEKQKSYPKEVRQRLLDFQIRPSIYKAMYFEISNWKQDAEIIKSLGTTLNVPLIVLDVEFSIKLGVQGGLPGEELRILEEKWQELITRQGNLSSNSKIVFAKNSSHSIYMDRPDIIIHSISEIINKIKIKSCRIFLHS
ncbi:Alpha/beta hydrolase family protein [Solibacillus isronensis B3W22]|uniref:Alpha/beta hydrolase family protein n=1 Tax=Solibacillus isronensis B3W22 TaxID=1224748 RepID=K1KV67_9BACL|nr:alpha/beta hydrolase [Solibacillus isronensis]AMO85773.1 alpha/beta hydrolase [Solibacillus silvestris]EKB46426.1 Alpha/beta hydrolase family protein [Solibacillus isronensis B3W22]